jgi:hypothetical protein
MVAGPVGRGAETFALTVISAALAKNVHPASMIPTQSRKNTTAGHEKLSIVRCLDLALLRVVLRGIFILVRTPKH